MTIGPAPIIKMLSISVRLGMLVHQRDKPFEEVMAVLRAGTRLRMMLDRKHRLADDPQTLIGLVKKRQMRRLDSSRQAFRVDDKAVVLARDLDRAGQHILDRMIGAPVAARHFSRCAAEGQRQQLMTEADAEYRLAGGDQVSQYRHRIDAGRSRVTGPVREKNAIRPMPPNILGRCGGGNHGDAATMRRKHSKDVAFGAVVDSDDVTTRAALDTITAVAIPQGLVPFVGLPAGDFLGQVHSLETGPVEGLRLEGRDI